jgi:hypothetical protein
VTAFLKALDARGIHAPTISEMRRADQSIEDITVEGDEVVLEIETSYGGGDRDTEYMRVPLAAVEDPSEANITAYIEAEAEKAQQAQLAKNAKEITEYKSNLWSPVQSLKRLGVPLKDILSQVETHYNWVDPKATEKK